MGKMEKMFEKKKKDGKELSGVEKDAKSHVLSSIRDLASGAMSDKLHGLKKVSVAAPDKAGLAKGLDLAKNLVGHNDGGVVGDSTAEELEDKAEGDEMGYHSNSDHVEGSDEEEAGESPLEEAMEDEHGDSDMSEDEINAKLEHLMALKKKLKK